MFEAVCTYVYSKYPTPIADRFPLLMRPRALIIATDSLALICKPREARRIPPPAHRAPPAPALIRPHYRRWRVHTRQKKSRWLRASVLGV